MVFSIHLSSIVNVIFPLNSILTVFSQNYTKVLISIKFLIRHSIRTSKFNCFGKSSEFLFCNTNLNTFTAYVVREPHRGYMHAPFVPETHELLNNK